MRGKRMKRNSVWIAAVLAVILVLSIVDSTVVLGASDVSTTDNYKKQFGNATSTKNAGRVWSDKTVLSDPQSSIDGNNYSLAKDENFNVVYSALATSQRIIGKTKVPLDVVFMLDVSSSMIKNEVSTAEGKPITRFEATVNALNLSINELLKVNPENRIAVTTWASNEKNYTTLVPLGKYNRSDKTNNTYVSTSNGKDIIEHLTGENNTYTIKSGATNTQIGIAEGMNVLLNTPRDSVERIPVGIVLSDGNANRTSEKAEWWSVCSGDTFEKTEESSLTVMRTLLTAAYKKQAVSEYYHLNNNKQAQMYTIGLGVEGEQINAVLDPTGSWNSKNSIIDNEIKPTFEKYLENNRLKPATLEWKGKKYIFKHPDTGIDITSLKYNDKYYEASDEAGLKNAFQEIVNALVATNPDYPTEIEGVSNPAQGGYITYTDPIGEYMEVKNVKAIIHHGKEYKLSSPETTGNITTYKGIGNVKDPVTGKDISLENVRVQVETAPDKSQTLKIKIPAAAIPLKIHELKLDEKGNVESNTVIKDENGKEPVPIRVVYSVGMQKGVDTLQGVTPEYIEKNTDPITQQVNFYSNRFSGKKENGKTVGDATTEFIPARDNQNYYIQEDTIIYSKKNADETLSEPTTEIKAGETYYFESTYYEGKDKKTEIVERTGDALLKSQEAEHIGTNLDGQKVIKEGTPRISHIINLSVDKTNNMTSTAETIYAPEFSYHNGDEHIIVRHGNNGKVQVEAPKSLIISKEVISDPEAPAPVNKEFRFDVTIENKKNLKVNAIVKNVDQVERNIEVSFDANGKAVIILKAGETITFPAIKGEYTVAEQKSKEVDGFNVVFPTNGIQSGTVGTKEDVVVNFKNEYKVDSITVDQAQFGFPITKKLIGRDFEPDDSFTFKIEGEKALPEKTEVTIQGNTLTGNEAEIDFGKFTFTKPGQYRYIISEVSGTTSDIPGINYDEGQYRLTVDVKDNGLGKLSVAGHKLEKAEVTGTGSSTTITWVNVENNKIVFTNEYKAEATTTKISGKKILNNKTLASYGEGKHFGFIIKAAGTLKDGQYVEDQEQPMPTNTTAVEVHTTGAIQFGNITFQTKDIDKTYKYIITERQPTIDETYEGKPLEGAEKDKNGNWVYRGVAFDHSEKEIIVKVTEKIVNQKSIVVATVEGNDFEFVNIYEAKTDYNFTDVAGGDKGIKNMSGRNFKDGDYFTFEVTSPADAPERAKLPEKVTINPKEGNTANINFGSVHFTQDDAGKSFIYTFKETKGSLGGVNYDTTIKKVTLTVKDDGFGKLTVIRTGDELVWNNSYHPEFKVGDEVTLDGKKVLTGKELTAGMFSFHVAAIDQAPMNGINETITNNADGSINLFDKVKYTAGDLEGASQKTFVYEITEDIPTSLPAGMVYDKAVYRVAITVTDDQNGKLIIHPGDVKVTKKATDGKFIDATDGIVFKNKYQSDEITVIPFEVNGNPMLSKKLIGPRKENLKVDEFKFNFELKSADPKDGVKIINEGTVGNKTGTMENPNTGAVSFENSKFTFSKAGVYVFTIKESDPTVEPNKVAGVTNKTPEIEITYTVTDVDGKLVAIPSFTGIVKDGVFVNEYETTSAVDKNEKGEIILNVNKEFTGREWQDKDVFKFRLVAGDQFTKEAIKNQAVIMPDNASEIKIINTTENHEARFHVMTLKKPGTYTFRVEEFTADENTGVQPGVHVDTVDRIITVVATDNGDGTMTNMVTIKAENAYQGTDKDNLIFKNVYKPKEAELKGKGNLDVTKVLEGREWLSTDEFAFVLEAAKDSQETNDAIKNGNIVLPNNATSIIITNKSVNQTNNFGTITFRKEGTYKFQVTEKDITQPEMSHIYKDESVKYVYVDVTLDKDGMFSANVDKSKSDKLIFTNQYTPDPANLAGATDLVVTKEVVGRDWLEGETFTFELSVSDKKTKQAIETGIVEMPENTKITVDATRKTNHFDDIIFKKAGKYVFDVTEKLPENVTNGKDGLTYDTSIHQVVINVTDDNQGKLVVALSASSQNLDFVNTYHPKDLPVDPTKDPDSDKDPNPDPKDPDPFPNPTPENPAKAGLRLNKNFTGREWLSTDSFTFRIEALDGAPMPSKAETTVTSATDKFDFGMINFTAQDMNGEAFKEFKYKVTEVVPAPPISGVIYDNKEIIYTITVEDDLHGKLKVTKLATNDADKTNIGTFNNSYQPEAIVFPATGNGDLQVTKIFTGREWKDTDEFSFNLIPTKATEAMNGNSENPAYKLEATTCTIKGTDLNKIASFGNITFYKEGIYTFEVREEIPEGAVQNEEGNWIYKGITYESVAKKITISVWDDKQGKLHADLDTKESEILKFTNTYMTKDVPVDPTKDPDPEKDPDPDPKDPNPFPNPTPENPAKAGLRLNKNLIGREWLSTDSFTFRIEALDGAPKPSKTETTVTSATDKFDFGIINFTAKDMNGETVKEFRYKVTEVIPTPSISGITYDKKTIVYTIKVEDDGQGQLKVTELAKNKADGTNVGVFENRYSAQEVDLEGKEAFAFKKVLEGRTWQDTDKFTFKLTGDDNAPMPEKTEVVVEKPANGKEAEFNFGSIHFGLSDMEGAKLVNGVRVKNFKYHVAEVVPEVKDGIVYDTEIRDVDITVTDDGTGRLKTSVMITGDKVFTNEYKTEIIYKDATGEAGLKLTKKLKNHILEEGQFQFEIKATNKKAAEKLNAIGGIDGNMVIQNGKAFINNTTAQWSIRPFDEMKFIKDKTHNDTGEYTFTIREIIPTPIVEGYTYDDTVYNVKISVVANKDGTLGVTTENADIVFNNTYNATGTLGGDVDIRIHATKTLTGRQMTEGEFTFHVVNLKNEQVVSTGTNTAENVANPNGAYLIKFNPIRYALDTMENNSENPYDSKTHDENGNEVYTYLYRVEEVLPVADGVTVQTPFYTISVKVTDDGKGHLIPEVLYPENMESLDFVNHYNADQISLNVNASKVLDKPADSNMTLEDIAGKYAFVMEGVKAEYTPLRQQEPVAEEVTEELTELEAGEVTESVAEETTKPEEVTESATKKVKESESVVKPLVEPTSEIQEIKCPLPENTMAYNDKAGNISFDPISYGLDIFEGVQPEEDGSRIIKFTYSITEHNRVPGITNDPEDVKSFTVTVKDDGKGHLEAIVDGKVEFVNVYKITPEKSSMTGSGQFELTKNLTGRKLKASEFTFELKDMDGTTIASGQNHDDGTVEMGEVLFEKPGVYHYTLSEVNGGKTLENGVTYDGKIWNIVALVEENKDGTLKVTWQSPDCKNKIIFNNLYDPKDTGIMFGASKILIGRTLQDAEFSFILKDENGNVLQTVKNNKNGFIPFEKIIYDKAGMYQYTLEEVNDGIEGIEYDTKSYTITIMVTDDEQGHLVAERTSEESAYVFCNTYTSTEKMDQLKPNKPIKPNTPSTGDKWNSGLWLVLLVISIGGVIGIVLYKIKRKFNR